MNWTTYHKASSVSEALSLLERSAGRGRVIAGGTDLVIQLHRRALSAEVLVDITGIDDLKRIEVHEGWILIGAAVTHAEVAANSLIRRHARVLSEGCSRVGSLQIRNMATLLGNVINAQPAADGAVPLTALEAEIRVVSKGAERWIPMEEAYLGVGRSAVDATGELAAQIRFRIPDSDGRAGFFRVSRRKALALPVLNGAVLLRPDAALTRIEKARIALGPVAAKPFRARGTEACLESGPLSLDVIHEAARIAAEEAKPRTSLIRGGERYRREMIRLQMTRLLQDLLAFPDAPAGTEAAPPQGGASR